MSDQVEEMKDIPEEENLLTISDEEMEIIKTAVMNVKTTGKGWGQIALIFKRGRLIKVDATLNLRVE
jgi:hypothetical protein